MKITKDGNFKVKSVFFARINPETVAEIIRIKSQVILLLTISTIDIFIYEPSIGVIPTIFCKSSVTSS